MIEVQKFYCFALPFLFFGGGLVFASLIVHKRKPDTFVLSVIGLFFCIIYGVLVISGASSVSLRVIKIRHWIGTILSLVLLIVHSIKIGNALTQKKRDKKLPRPGRKHRRK